MRDNLTRRENEYLNTLLSSFTQLSFVSNIYPAFLILWYTNDLIILQKDKIMSS